jgi:hypothetical protein
MAKAQNNEVKDKKKKKKKKKKKRIIDKQKVFWAVSIAFLFSCVLFYGVRLIYYHHKFNGSDEGNNSMYQVVISNNYDDKALTNINGDYYFVGNDVENYVEYSNILFRIVKLNANGTITLIADKAVSNLAMGEEKNYKESYVYEWLNEVKDKDDTGILLNSLNNISNYLTKSVTCLDKVDEANNGACVDEDSNDYITLLSISDYINTGNVDSFINNGQYFYLSTNNSDNDSWYVNSNGKVGTNDGSDVYGIRPVITIAKSLEIISGNGTKNNPYKIEKDNGIFGSYVKLGEDIWRIYQVNDTEYKLMLNDYLMIDGDKLEYSYSNINYKYNDTEYGSLAYYLNRTYLNGLSYKDLIIDSKYSNGYYTKDDYKETYSTEIESKVGIISVGDIILNSDLDEYYTSTGNVSEGKMIYVVKNNGRLVTKSIRSTAYVVPCISISKEILVSGDGSISNPYGLE